MSLQKPSFLRDERGAVTVESILWILFFMLFFAMMVDASLIFHHQTSLNRVIHDANRAYSLGKFSNEQETEDWITAYLDGFSDNLTVSTTLNGDMITTVLTVPAGDLMATGLIETFSDITVTIAASHYKEV